MVRPCGARDFVDLAVLAARAQQGERMRRIGVLLPATADDPAFQAWVGALHQALGRNVRIDTRWGGGKFEDIRYRPRCSPTPTRSLSSWLCLRRCILLHLLTTVVGRFC